MMTQQAGPTIAARRGPLLVFFLVLVFIVAACIVGGLIPRLTRQKTLAAGSLEASDRKPVVLTSAAHFAGGKESIDLPADLIAMIDSPILSRADGYLKSRLVDLGYHVTAGQLMAELETPELDQQITQAKATVAQAQATIKELRADIDLAKANLDLARVTWERWHKLQEQGIVARQDADAKQADLAVKDATAQRAEASLATAQETIRSSQANLQRLEELKSFARITAPFEGVVTAREVDIGTLITAGNKEMFRVAKLDPMRIFVNVPQTYVAEIHSGLSAELHVQEHPGRVFQAKVNNISHALDTNSRAMLAVLLTPNPDGALLPGMYAQVRFASARSHPVLRVAGDAVVLGKTGPTVATVGADHMVHFKPVTLGQDLGAEVEILSGLKEGEMVISNPSDSVQENAVVEVRAR